MSTRNRNSKGAQFEITNFYLKKNLKIHKYSIYEEKNLQNKFIKSKIIVFVYNLGKLLLVVSSSKVHPSVPMVTDRFLIVVFYKFVSVNMT